VTTLRQGRFIRVGASQVVLVDDYNNRWSVERVGFLDGAWGYDQDGTARLPRPWVYDDSSNVVVRGDVVLIDFLDDDPRQPVVRGGLRRYGSSGGFLDTSFDDGAEQVRMQQRVRDPQTGAVQGALRVQVGPDDGTMTITVLAANETTERAVITVAPDGIQVRGSEVVLGSVTPGIAEPLIKGSTYLQDEVAAAIQETPIIVAAGGFFGLPVTEPPARLTKLTTSTTGTGEPYLSETSKTE
jgi:hypothetical protein